MSDSVREAIDELQAGSEIELELDDGSKVSGTVESIEDGVIRLEGDDQQTVAADDVAGVVEVINSEGPE